MSQKLLIVDDNKGCDELYKMRFEKAGFEVKVVYSAEDAQGLLKSYHPDVILLDLMLPKMQGDELLKILKSDEETKDIKVMVLTALNLNNDDAEKVKGIADDFALKISVLPRELVKRVNSLLGNKETKVE